MLQIVIGIVRIFVASWEIVVNMLLLGVVTNAAEEPSARIESSESTISSGQKIETRFTKGIQAQS